MSMALIFQVDNRGAKFTFLAASNVATFFLIRKSQAVPNYLTNGTLVSNSCDGRNRIIVSKNPEGSSKPWSLRA